MGEGGRVAKEGRWTNSEFFDIEAVIGSYKFWLMAKIRLPNHEIFKKRHDAFLKELKAYILENSDNNTAYAQKIENRVTTSAWNTIPNDFKDNILKVQGLNKDGDKVQNSVFDYKTPTIKKKKK